MTRELDRKIGRLLFYAAAIMVVMSPGAQAAIESRTILKSYFETGDVPTQDQFSNLIDSYIHQTDDGLTLFGVGGVEDGSARGIAARTGEYVGINEVLPDTLLGPAVYIPPQVSAPPEMCTMFCGQSGFLPLKYLDTAGEAHYGFLQVEMGADSTSPIFVTKWVWESSANTTLTTFAVPEPAVAAMLVFALPLALGRRR